MTRRPSLGRALALAGAGIAAAAVIAGFIVIGGPGDARNTRLDGMTEWRIKSVVDVIQCAFNTTGAAPESYEAAKKVPNSSTSVGSGFVVCEDYPDDPAFDVGSSDQPAAPGDISYVVTGPTQVKLCGNFRTSADKRVPESSGQYGGSATYRQLIEPRPAGVHCYVLDLIKMGLVQRDAF